MINRFLLHGIVSAILAAIAASIYNRIYFFATEADFSRILGIVRIISINLFVCLLASFVNYFLIKWLKQRGEIVFNFLFSIISFAMLIIPISISLPLDIKNPELFPGLAVPMVFFPAIAWYTTVPFFRHNDEIQ